MHLDHENRLRLFCERIAQKKDPDELLELALEIEALLHKREQNSACQMQAEGAW